ncbi:hypothetical protein SAMN05444359_110141 [Neolewinella agarilytica]|uniref:Uncharacterized protein n=1 Tax=Neolewinella agarilytica TaxID=478744 RepID=A0A1H9GDS2_9BACT|nr:hypothetical protein SAMN05444359_110141 [Neolewinella agarilytica]
MLVFWFFGLLGCRIWETERYTVDMELLMKVGSAPTPILPPKLGSPKD